MYCVIPIDVSMEIRVTSSYVPGTLRMDVNDKNKWQPGTELTWSLIERSHFEGDEEVIRDAFKMWTEICFIKFRRMKDGDNSAMIRIGFDQSVGCWSLIGTDALQRKYIEKKTMNFSVPLLGKKYVVLHVIGHALGFPHEHQNPNSGIVWNVKGVYTELEKKGWDKETVDHNILSPHKGFHGFPFDPHSIMNFGFSPNLIKEPEQFRSGLPIPQGFSEQDQKLAQKFYPFPLQHPDQLSIGNNGGMLSTHLKKDEIKIIHLQFNSQLSQFHLSSLVTIPNTIVEIVLKNGKDIIASGITNSTPLKGYVGGNTQFCDWFVELKGHSPNTSEIPVTVIVF